MDVFACQRMVEYLSCSAESSLLWQGCGCFVVHCSDEMTDVNEAGAGDIVAMFGVDCSSGETFTSGEK
jgi:hypothetical protein